MDEILGRERRRWYLLACLYLMDWGEIDIFFAKKVRTVVSCIDVCCRVENKAKTENWFRILYALLVSICSS